MRPFQGGLRLATALLISMAATLNSGAALAAAVSFAPQPNLNGGAIIGRVPLTKLGNLSLPRGRAYFKSNMVEVTAVPEYQFDRQQVLSGPILKCWSTIAGNAASINGIAYFQDGDWLKYVDESAPDKIITADDTFTGQITAMKNGYLEITQTSGAVKQIPIPSVEQIVSPRAYSFSIPVTAFLSVPQGQPISGETTSVTLKPTSRTIALAVVKRDPLLRGDGDISTKKLTALWAGISAVEILQFLPLVLLETKGRTQILRQYHDRTRQSQQDANFTSVTGALYQNSPLAPGANPYLSYPISGLSGNP